MRKYSQQVLCLMNLQKVQVNQQIIIEQHWAETYHQIKTSNYFPLVKYLRLTPKQKFG